MRYDVIIVGAGPAGSTTARECAARGLSVLLLDKAVFPRDKACGGGVTVRAARLLPFDLSPVIERTTLGIRFSLARKPRIARSSLNSLVHFTQRRRLDFFLLEQARKAGAVVLERIAVREIDRPASGSNSQVTIRTSDGAFQGRALVAADGANGTTTRQIGLVVPRWMGIAIEGNISPNGQFPSPWEHHLGIDAGDTPGGYGWVFPKGDHLNFGVGGLPAVGFSVRNHLHRLVRTFGFDAEALWGVRGFPLPIRKPNTPLVSGNSILVGDAGGFIDPLSGEGIYGAIKSGYVAAKHLTAYLDGAARNLTGYQNEMEHGIVQELAISHRLWMLLHLSPPHLAERFNFSDSGWNRVCGVIRGDDHLVDVVSDLKKLWSITALGLRPAFSSLIHRLIIHLRR